MRNRVFAFVAIGALSACSSSPPMRYYTLSVTAPGGASTSGAASTQTARETAPASGAASQGASAATTPVHVGSITIPGEIDRMQLVNRIDANRLQVSDMDRWAAPLDEMIRRTLAADLAARMPAGSVSNLGESQPGQKRRVLSLDIQEFHGETDCSVTLRAAWIVSQPDSPGLRGTESLTVPSNGACPESLPAGMSRALAELSDRIASALGGDAKLGAQ